MSEQLEVKPRSPLGLRIAVVVVPIIAVLSLFAIVAFRARPVTSSGPAPSWTLERLDAEGRLSSDELRGKPYVVNVWASWCVPCREEAPALAAVARDSGVAFVGMDVLDGRDEAVKFLREEGISYPNVMDTQSVHRRMGVTGVPETVFVDAKGVVAGRWIGLIDEPTLRRLVEDLKAGRKITTGGSDKRNSVV